MALFNDRRSTALIDVVNPAEQRRASLARPDKPGQASRSYMARTQRVHNDVLAGHAAVINPVPPVVQQRVAQGTAPYAARDILPQRGGRMSRVAAGLRRVDNHLLGRPSRIAGRY